MSKIFHNENENLSQEKEHFLENKISNIQNGKKEEQPLSKGSRINKSLTADCFDRHLMYPEPIQPKIKKK